MKYHYQIALFWVLIMIPARLLAAEPTAAEQLARQLQGMDSLTASFNQKIQDSKGSVLQEASGSLTVKRPRRFYWRTEQPYEHLVVTDGELLWLYDIDLEQITRQVFSADLDKAPALLLSGELEQINQQYDINISRSNAELVEFSLVPKSGDSLFRHLLIAFNQGQLLAMTLQDSFDQQTHIQFSNVTLNPAVADTLFQFTPPEGIDVISDER